jgi:hypothetical protein
MGVTAGLRGKGDGLLGGVGSIEALVVIMFVLPARVLGGVRCSVMVDAMLCVETRYYC